MTVDEGRILTAEGIQMRFGGVTALDGVSVHIPAGRVSGLIGPNGAGKSTLLGILSGAHRPDFGTVRFNGVNLTGAGRTVAAHSGVIQTFQKASPFRGMTVLENVLVGMTNRFDPGLFGVLFRPRLVRRTERQWRERAQELLEEFGLSEYAQADAASLSFGQLRLLELARAMLAEPQILLLDEPAAGLNAQETKLIHQAVVRVRDNGVGVLIVDHDVRFLFGLCDHIIAMDYGRIIAEGPPEDVERDPAVRAAYLTV